MLFILINDYNRYNQSNKQFIFIKNKSNPILFLIDFCKKLKPTDRICYLNYKLKNINIDFDFLNNLEITNKLLITQYNNPLSIIDKYIIDKNYKTSTDFNINPNFLLGYVKQIQQLLINYDDRYTLYDILIDNYHIDRFSIIPNKIFYTKMNILSDQIKIKNKFIDKNEIIFILVCLIILYSVKDHSKKFLILLFIYLEFIHYQLYVKHVRKSIGKKKF